MNLFAATWILLFVVGEQPFTIPVETLQMCEANKTKIEERYGKSRPVCIQTGFDVVEYTTGHGSSMGSDFYYNKVK